MGSPPPVRPLPVVAVLGSGSEPHADRADALGAWLARAGAHLLTGGGGGVMTAVSRAFCAVEGRRGLALGILPGDASGRAPAGYPNPYVELAIRTHLPWSGRRGTDSLSRNHLNVLSAGVIVALPGGYGTSSEVALALRYGRPLVAWLDARSDIPELPGEVPVESGFEGVQRFVEAVWRQGGPSVGG